MLLSGAGAYARRRELGAVAVGGRAAARAAAAAGGRGARGMDELEKMYSVSSRYRVA